jgi:UDP-GlcNAc:undecaprenyl-phosphate GlcNAc-1-phosphate transferase
MRFLFEVYSAPHNDCLPLQHLCKMASMLGIALAPFIIGLLLSAISIPVIIKVAHLKNLHDDPDEVRKLHKSSIPTLGGIAIFAGALVAFSSLYDLHGFGDLRFITPALVILFFAGVKDDLLVLAPLKKLLIQIGCALLITIAGNLRLTSLWGIMTIQDIPYWSGVLITTILIVGLINAYNLIDGINGLAGSLGLLATLFFGAWFAASGFGSLSILSFSLAGALLGFLFYNYNNAKIFMGDTGSMAVGFIIAVLAIRFVETNRLQLDSLPYPIINAPAVAFAVLSIPLFDMVRVFSYRLMKKRSPFQADRNHIHHHFVDCGFSHAKATSILFAINVSCILIAFPLNQMRSAWGVLILLGYMSILYLVGLSLFSKKRRSVQVSKLKQSPSQTRT